MWTLNLGCSREQTVTNEGVDSWIGTSGLAVSYPLYLEKRKSGEEDLNVL